MSDIDDLISRLRQDEQGEKAERKSNDCIDWMCAHWKLFARSRRDFDRAYKQCGQQFAYTPDGLAEALGLDERIRFVKISFNDIPGQLMKLQGSKMLEQFKGMCKGSDEAAMMVIAGDRTCVVTNMQTRFVDGLVHMYLKAGHEGNDINIIGWRDLQARLPQLFDHSGDSND